MPLPPLHPEVLTWTALLGRWIEFAQGALAIPHDDDGDLWRAVIADVITLQAVTFSLGDLAEVAPDERPLARDKATILVRAAATNVDRAWRGVPLPPALASIVADAHDALDVSVWAGAVELSVELPAEPGREVEPFVMPVIDPGPPDGTLAVMQPGTIAMPGEPVAWWVDRAAPDFAAQLSGVEQRENVMPRQVYRQLAADFRVERDVVVPIIADPRPGFPLLVPLCENGRSLGSFTMDAEEWLARQRVAMPESGRVPVVEEGEDEG